MAKNDSELHLSSCRGKLYRRQHINRTTQSCKHLIFHKAISAWKGYTYMYYSHSSAMYLLLILNTVVCLH